jgi:hypothetical protein
MRHTCKKYGSKSRKRTGAAKLVHGVFKWVWHNRFFKIMVRILFLVGKKAMKND